MPFLSLVDDRAKPKGSRDPLGFELVWTHFGRKVVGNLTTITSSLENFAVALLGFHWANELNLNVGDEDKQKAVRETFLCYEQVAAYLRYYGKSNTVMGITRVKERVLSGANKGVLNIGLGADEQILSDQASYGLWGLYATAMRDTGLVSGNERVLTEKGLVIVKELEYQLDKPAMMALMRAKRVRTGELEALSEEYMAAIKDSSLVNQLFEALMTGAEGNLIQKELWHKTHALFDQNYPLEHHVNKVSAYISCLKERGLSNALEQCLVDIECVERVLVALNNIFHYCRVKDGVKLNEVITHLHDQGYNFDYLPKHLPDVSFPRRQPIQMALDALKAGDYKQAISAVLKLNDLVMKQRNGAAWVDIEPNGTLRVRVKSETAALASNQLLQERWDYDYFLGSYLSMAQSQLGRVRG